MIIYYYVLIRKKRTGKKVSGIRNEHYFTGYHYGKKRTKEEK